VSSFFLKVRGGVPYFYRRREKITNNSNDANKTGRESERKRGKQGLANNQGSKDYISKGVEDSCYTTSM
jgi:hypothetical protein